MNVSSIHRLLIMSSVDGPVNVSFSSSSINVSFVFELLSVLPARIKIFFISRVESVYRLKWLKFINRISVISAERSFCSSDD